MSLKPQKIFVLFAQVRKASVTKDLHFIVWRHGAAGMVQTAAQDRDPCPPQWLRQRFNPAPLSYRKMDFEEFCAAAISPHHLEALDGWEQMTSTTFEHFEREGNRAITVKELAQFTNLKYSRVEIDEVPFEWVECMLDYI
ncbi:hypothetical protein ZIOFF_056123 [Zingiber officinale]|uniref:Uncharacterized protein n=1 Tax=Zingiber officinale TaxID=94328 RepID=A0A8J5KSN7_ZINOF|nr:hypothetical protein ZIOFF_056123 [Zingiber officinale]